MKPSPLHPTTLARTAVTHTRGGQAGRRRPFARGTHHAVRALGAALGTTLALLLAGCGPGVGGTGTGSDAVPALADFGATAAPLCDSAVAGALRCVPPPAPTDTAQTLPVWLSDTDPAVRAVALIFGNQVELQLRCEGLQFAGLWGRAVGEGTGRFYGQAQRADGSVLRATLALDLTAGGLLASLRGLDGALLAAPVLLVDRSGPPAAAACP